MAESAQTKLRRLCARLNEENARLDVECKKLAQRIAELEREMERFRKTKRSPDHDARDSPSLTVE
jgi:predicted RNase H-like nuclease (RuvC/YqgF family)